MSAILARINFDGAPIDRDAFCRAFEVMAQYGGDGANTWIEGSAGLGQHLLRFTPESSYEQQPHQWENAVIVADARIDNRDELCHWFDLSPAEAAVTPDSHLILRAYRLWGEDCTAHLLGDFAFAIWDQQHQRLFCARDHIGARPLYYYHTPSTTVVSTDIRALQALPDISYTIDELEVVSYLSLPIATKQTTFFKQFHILHPGQQISLNKEGLSQRIHWSTDNAPEIRYKTLEDYAKHLRSILEAAIAARIRTEFPIGAHLSGGLDSSGITVLANRLLCQQGRSLDMTYSWSPARSDTYPSIQKDERDTIEALCEQENISCHYGTATGKICRDSLARDIAIEDIPNLWEELPVLVHAQKHGLRTILSGWGGDEGITFGGRGYPAYLLQKGRLIQLARLTRKYAGFRRPRRTLRYLFRYAVIPLLPDALYDRVDPHVRFVRLPSYASPSLIAKFRQAAQPSGPYLREIANPRRQQLQLVHSGHLAARMATWAAWTSTHRLVHTYPLTDRRILEYALGLPPEMVYQQGVTRYLFKEALKDILPPLPPKADPVNEQKRLDCELGCWQILADEVRAGEWAQPDVPWLDMDKIRAKLLAVPDEMTPDQLLELAALTPAVRIWHLWQRYGERTGD